MKKLLKLLVVVFALVLVVSPIKAEKSRLVDNAQILTEDEFNNVKSRLDAVSERYNVDVVILTVNSTEGKTLQTYADDAFDSMGYGIGSDRSGIMMLVDMNQRYIYFTTRGKCIEAFTDYGLYELENTIIDEMIDYGYAAGCNKFATEANRYLGLYEKGTPIDVEPEEPTEFNPSPVASGVLGALVALISSLGAKGKNKSVAKKTGASDYKVDGSFHVTGANDWFLYRNVSRTRIQRDDHDSHSFSGGSSTHVSSSGATHGGGGGNRHF